MGREKSERRGGGTYGNVTCNQRTGREIVKGENEWSEE
jgi:hypothetical protein